MSIINWDLLLSPIVPTYHTIFPLFTDGKFTNSYPQITMKNFSEIVFRTILIHSLVTSHTYI